MSTFETLVWLAALWTLAEATPGPNMLFFSGVALSSSGRAAAAAGAGIVLATALWGLAGLFGLLWLFEAVPALTVAVKVAGGLYLTWMGVKILLGSVRTPAAERMARSSAPLTPAKAFSVGLATNLANPKALVYVTSLFAVTHLPEAPLGVGLAGVALMTAISTGAFAVLGLVLRLMPIGRVSPRLKRAAGLAFGAGMAAFGVRMAVDR